MIYRGFAREGIQVVAEFDIRNIDIALDIENLFTHVRFAEKGFDNFPRAKPRPNKRGKSAKNS